MSMYHATVTEKPYSRQSSQPWHPWSATMSSEAKPLHLFVPKLLPSILLVALRCVLLHVLVRTPKSRYVAQCSLMFASTTTGHDALILRIFLKRFSEFLPTRLATGDDPYTWYAFDVCRCGCTRSLMLGSARRGGKQLSCPWHQMRFSPISHRRAYSVTMTHPAVRAALSVCTKTRELDAAFAILQA